MDARTAVRRAPGSASDNSGTAQACIKATCENCQSEAGKRDGLARKLLAVGVALQRIRDLDRGDERAQGIAAEALRALRVRS